MKQLSLNVEQQRELEEAMKSKNTSGRYLKRLQSIKLNSRGYAIASISELLEVHYNSVYNWLKRYEQGGLPALAEKPRSGRPKLLSDEQEEQVRDWVDEEPRRLKQVLGKVEASFAVKLSQDTLKRILKRGTTATGG
jgi:transposase